MTWTEKLSYQKHTSICILLTVFISVMYDFAIVRHTQMKKWHVFIANNQFGSFEEAIIIYSGLKYSHQRHGNALTKEVIQYFKNTTRSAYC